MGCSGKLLQPLLMMCFALGKKMLRWFSQHLLIMQSCFLLRLNFRSQTLKCESCMTAPWSLRLSGDPLLS